jgi:hypothetical protein
MKCRIAIALLFAAIGVFAGDIFLIGDSIRQGYAPEVKRICAEHGKNVYCPKENCKFSQFTYRFLHKWASSVKDPLSVEAVHWNNGLWDLGEVVPGECTTPIEMYTNMLVRTAREIRRLFPAARIVFATTTPVNTLVNDKWHTRGNVEVERYNALALTALEGEVDAINDLYAYVKEKSLEKYYKDTVHFTPDGYKALAERVVSAIEQALSSPVATRGGNEKNMKSVAEYVSEEPGFQRELKGARFKFSCNRPDAVYKLGELRRFCNPDLLRAFNKAVIICSFVIYYGWVARLVAAAFL